MTRANLARAGFTVFAAFLASRILGWVRVVVLVGLFGDTADGLAQLDAYYAAFRIPDLIYQLVAAGAIASALVPILSDLLGRGKRARAWRVASAVANIVLLSMTVAAVVMFVFAPEIVPAMVSGYGPEKTAKTVELTRMMLLSPIFLSLGAVVSSILNSENRFGAAAVAPVVYNLAIIVCAIALAPFIGIDGAAVGVVLGSVLHFAIQVPALRGTFRWVPGIRTRDPMTRQTIQMMLPRAVALGASQITFIVNTSLASAVVIGTLGSNGAVSIYNVAFNVLQIPLGIVAVPVGIVLLPALSRSRSGGDDSAFAGMVTQTVRLLFWMTAFLVGVGLVLRTQSLQVLFPRSLDAANLDETASVLAVFLLGLPAHAVNVILARAFYAGKDTRTPVIVAVLSVGVNIAVSLLTVDTWGLAGLALGIALGGWFDAVVLIVILHRRVPDFRLEPMLGSVSFVLGAVVAAVIALAVATGVAAIAPALPWVSAVLQVTAGGLAAGLGYLLYSRLVRLPELPRALGLARSALRRA